MATIVVCLVAYITLYIGSTYIGDRQQLCVGVCGSCGDRSAVVTKTMGYPVMTKKSK